MSSSVLPMFSSKSFIVSGLTFRSLILLSLSCVQFQGVFYFNSFTCSCPVSQHHLLKRLSLPHCIFLPYLIKISSPQVPGFISWPANLFHQSIFLFLCQYHTVLMTVALQYSLKSGRLIPPVPFFFLKITLAIRGFLYFTQIVKLFVLVL